MKRDVPPYRADHVGSILRSAPLKEARNKHAAGQLSATELKAIEDAEIRKIIAKQEEVGLRSITDGEFRRAYWHFDFLSGLDGVEMVGAAQGIQFTGVQSKAEAPFVKSKLGSRHHPQIAHFEFLKANTKRTPKMTIPSPSMLHYRGGRKMIDTTAYPTMDEFYRISDRPISTRSRASMPPAAAICSSTTAASPICATRHSAGCSPSAATIPTGRARSTPA